MLKFTNDQMTLLEDEVYHTFLHRVVGHLEEYCAAACAHLDDQQKFAVADDLELLRLQLAEKLVSDLGDIRDALRDVADETDR